MEYNACHFADMTMIFSSNLLGIGCKIISWKCAPIGWVRVGGAFSPQLD